MSLITSSSSEVSTLDDFPVARRRRLIEAILFSRSWTPTYLYIAGGILLIFIIQTWFERLSDITSRRKYGDDAEHDRKVNRIEDEEEDVDSGPSSSGSSTIKGTETPNDHSSQFGEDGSLKLKGNGDFAHSTRVDEETPLISTKPRRSWTTRVRANVQAFLMHQPAPISGLTTSTNVLPSTGQSLFILLLFIPNIFYLFYRIPVNLDSLLILADRAGLLIVVNLPILYILGAKNNPLRLLVGHSYESINIFHRRLGEWLVFLAVLHGVAMTIVFWPIFRGVGYSFWRFLLHPIIAFGFLTLLLYIVLYGTSIGYMRERYYEAFLAIHIVGQLGALIFLYLHYERCRVYVVVSGVVWAVDRVLMRILVVPVSLRANATLTEDGETVLLTVKLSVTSEKQSPGILSRTINDGWRPGQHVFITVPSLGRTANLQAHPYTILSMPDIHVSETDGSAYRSLDLIIRAKDGFTHELLRYVTKNGHPCGQIHTLEDLGVRIEGPYGSTEALEAAETADRALFIAGGSGIAVTSPLATAVLRSQQSRLSDPKHDDDKRSTARLAHYWITRSHVHLTWLSRTPPSSPARTGAGRRGPARGPRRPRRSPSRCGATASSRG